MRARFAYADALLQVHTKDSIEKALRHLTDMLRLCRRDTMGVRNIIPAVLHQLGRVQECYDFLKWWATVDLEHYNWDDTTLPFLDVHNADVFEPVDEFCARSSLSHLVILTLLKLTLRLDLDDHQVASIDTSDSEDSDDDHSRDVTRFAMKHWDLGRPWLKGAVAALKAQYDTLCRAVHRANPYFWDALVDWRTWRDSPTMLPQLPCIPGSREEAQLVLYQCNSAWHDACSALMMIKAETSELVAAYHGPSFVASETDGLGATPVKQPESFEEDPDVNASAVLNQATEHKPEMPEADFRDLAITITMTAAPEPTTTPPPASSHQSRGRILVLCFDSFDPAYDYWQYFTTRHTTLVTQLSTKTHLIFEMLTPNRAPPVILVANGAISRHQTLLERLIDRLRDGATVVLAGCFSTSTPKGPRNRFFARLGLPWRADSCHRAAAHLRSEAVGDRRLAGRLPFVSNRRAVLLRGVDPSAVWYGRRGEAGEAAVVFARVGGGRLGYVGFVSGGGQEGVDAVVLGMCGLWG